MLSNTFWTFVLTEHIYNTSGDKICSMVTPWDPGKIVAISQTTFPNAFSYMNMYISLKISLLSFKFTAFQRCIT